MESQHDVQNNIISTDSVSEEKYVPLDQTFVLLYIFALLDAYDKSIRSNKKQLPESNPYTDKIMLKTDNGKYVELPGNVQKYAIEKWDEIKKNKSTQLEKPIISGTNQDNDDTDDEGKPCIACRKDKINSDSTLIDTTFQLILCLVMIFTILYTLSLIRKGAMHFDY